jgi:caa(3)-type oxidase subunit IV
MSKLRSNMVWLAILMVVTIIAGMAPSFPIPGWYDLLKNAWPVTNTLAIGIACWKAYLVVSIFMGVRYSTKLVKLYAVGGFVWFFTLFLILADYIARPAGDVVLGWEPSAGTTLQSSPAFLPGEGGEAKALPGRVRYGDYRNPEKYIVEHGGHGDAHGEEGH